ncbi:MAG: hypothetical protein Q9181_001300 [Wetmoreana brouardii]
MGRCCLKALKGQTKANNKGPGRIWSRDEKAVQVSARTTQLPAVQSDLGRPHGDG